MRIAVKIIIPLVIILILFSVLTEVIQESDLCMVAHLQILFLENLPESLDHISNKKDEIYEYVRNKC